MDEAKRRGGQGRPEPGCVFSVIETNLLVLDEKPLPLER
jgi:hypothetical protein